MCGVNHFFGFFFAHLQLPHFFAGFGFLELTLTLGTQRSSGFGSQRQKSKLSGQTPHGQ